MKSRLKARIYFTDYYPASKLPGPTGKAMEIFDPVNETNNVAAVYDESHRQKIVSAAQDALEAISEARFATTGEGRLSAGRTCWDRLSEDKNHDIQRHNVGHFFHHSRAQAVVQSGCGHASVRAVLRQAFGESRSVITRKSWRSILNAGYVKEYEFGYQEGWQARRDLALQGGCERALTTDERPGKVVPYVDVAGANFFNYPDPAIPVFTGSPDAQQARLRGGVALSANGRGPAFRWRGYWTSDRNYFSGGRGLEPPDIPAAIMKENNVGIFEEVREFPDPGAARRYAALVGLDEVKERLLKEARLLLDPESLAAWSTKHHGKKTAIINLFRDRPPLFIFAGDVGQERRRWLKRSAIRSRARRTSGHALCAESHCARYRRCRGNDEPSFRRI